MPENLSEETKCLLEVAENEAKELGCLQVETSHLLLALILDKGRIGEILKSVGATEKAAREYLKPSEHIADSQSQWRSEEPKPELQRVTNPAKSSESSQMNEEKTSREAPDEPTKKVLPLSADAEIILERAAQEAYSWRHDEVGNVHVLQCLLGIYEPEDPEFKLLLAMGVDHTALKRKVGIHLKLLPRQGVEQPVAVEKMELPELTFESFTEPFSVELDVSPTDASRHGFATDALAGPERTAKFAGSGQGHSGSFQNTSESLVENPGFNNWMVESERHEQGASRLERGGSRLELSALVAKFFTPEAQAIIERSRQMADRNFAPSVGVHHILLAILDIEGTNVHTMLNRYFHTRKMQSVLLEEVPPGVPEVEGGYFTREAVAFLDLCWQTAEKWKFSKITPDIMLLQLLDECNREFFKDFVIVNAVGPIPDAVFLHVIKDILNLYPDIEGGLPTRYLKERLSDESENTSRDLPWLTEAQDYTGPTIEYPQPNPNPNPNPHAHPQPRSRSGPQSEPAAAQPQQVSSQSFLNEDDEASAWMQGAKYEASRLSMPLIGVQHLFLSILVGQKSEVSSFLRAHVYADRLRMALELIVHDCNDPENLKENRFTVAAIKVLQKAHAISLAQRRSSIAPQDLLWALLECAPASSVAGVVDGCSGTTAEELMNRVINHFFGAAASPHSAESRSASWSSGPTGGATTGGVKAVDRAMDSAANFLHSLTKSRSDAAAGELNLSEPPAASVIDVVTAGGAQRMRIDWPAREDFQEPKTAKRLILDWFAKDVAEILRLAETLASREGTCIDFSHMFQAILLADDNARTRQILAELLVFQTLFAKLKRGKTGSEEVDRAFSSRMILAMEEAWKHAKSTGYVAGEHLLIGMFTVLASTDSDVKDAVEFSGNAKIDELLSLLQRNLERRARFESRKRLEREKSEPQEKSERREKSANTQHESSLLPARSPEGNATMTKLAKSYVDLSSGPSIPETRIQHPPELIVTSNVLEVLCDALDVAKECKHLTATAYHVTCSLLVKALDEQYHFGWLRREFVAALQAYLLDLTDVKTDLEDLSGSVPRFGPDVRALMEGAHREKLARRVDRFVDLQHIGLALLEWQEVSEAFSQHGMQPQSIKRALENCLNWHRGRPLIQDEVGFPLDLDVLEDLYMQENLGASARGHNDDYLKRLSSRSRYVLRSAGKASELFGNNEVAVEHVLLGLLREKECVAADVLSAQGIDFHEALAKYMSVCSKGCKRHSAAQRLSTKSHRILKTAWKFAQEFKQVLVEPEHILLSIVQEHEGVAFLAWNCLNLSAKETKSLLLSRLRGG